jgi:mRNA interferase RelE/StbE
MDWQITFTVSAEKSFSKLDKTAQKNIVNYFKNRILSSGNPKLFGKPLLGELKGIWRYRVDDYRILCKINDNILEILVVDVGHRSKIYN